MSAETMADGSPVTPELDARMLADLREWRARVSPDDKRWSMRLTIDELDMLLRRCADLDIARRQACADPDEIEPSAGVRAAVVEIPAGHALVKGEVVPLAPSHPGVMHIAGKPGVLCGADRVSHVTDGRRYADCPACIAVFESRRCDAICDGDGGRSSCFTPWCRCTVCHGASA